MGAIRSIMALKKKIPGPAYGRSWKGNVDRTDDGGRWLKIP
jgi:hypothetical protein